MSASEKLKALEARYIEGQAIMAALPQIVAVVEAAEVVSITERTGILPDFMPLAVALSALEEALS